MVNTIINSSDVDFVTILTTHPQRYGQMDGVNNFELESNYKILRFTTPKHNNSFLKQIVSFIFFAKKAYKYAIKNSSEYDIIFATTSRLGTGFLGYQISKKTKKYLYLDIRDIFSDNLKSLKLFKNFLGSFFLKLIAKIESKIIKSSKWVNFVSEGFNSYTHISNLKKEYKYFTNGIDDIFVDNFNQLKKKSFKIKKSPLLITYAGNIGYGQGLELIIIPLALHYKDKILFRIIGDGNSKALIENEIIKHNLDNIDLMKPIDRIQLLDYYNSTDVLFLHLNDIPSFENVLPSKIFDYGALNKPILAGVKGYAKNFLSKNLQSAYLFDPCDKSMAIKQIDKIILDGVNNINNDEFVKCFSRKKIMNEMLSDIVNNYKSKKIA